jgi:hypothetical protein
VAVEQTQARLGAAVRGLYDTLVLGAGGGWPDLATQIGAAFDAPAVTIKVYQEGVQRGRMLAAVGQPPKTERAYHDYYWRMDPAAQMRPRNGTPVVFAHKPVSLDRAQMRNQYFADFLAPRAEHALRLAQSVRGANTIIAQERPLLDAMLHGVALLDGEGRVQHLNPTALATIRGSGTITCRANRLEARNPKDRQKLSHAIQAVLSGSTPAAGAALTGSKLTAFTVTVIALTEGAPRILGGRSLGNRSRLSYSAILCCRRSKFSRRPSALRVASAWWQGARSLANACRPWHPNLG